MDTKRLFSKKRLTRVPLLLLFSSMLTACNSSAMQPVEPQSRVQPNPNERSETQQFSTPLCLAKLSCTETSGNSPFESLVLISVSHSPAVQKARAEVDRAEYSLKSAKSGFFPTISAKAEMAGNTSPIVASISQPIWGAGRLKAARLAAEADLDAARAMLAMTQIETAISVTEVYQRWVEADRTEAILALGIKEHANILDAVKRRREVGISGKNEIALVESRLARLESEKLAVNLDKLMAETKLNSIYGRKVPESVLEASADNVDELQFSTASAIYENPKIKLAEAEMRRAEAAEASARAERFPILGIIADTASTGHAPVGISNGRVYLGVSTNLGPGQSAKYRINEAIATQKTIVADLQLQKQLLRDELEILKERLRTSELSAKAHRNEIEALEHVLDSYQLLRTESGSKSWQEVLSVARELTDARQKLAVNEALRISLRWRLVLLTQGFAGF